MGNDLSVPGSVLPELGCPFPREKDGVEQKAELGGPGSLAALRLRFCLGSTRNHQKPPSHPPCQPLPCYREHKGPPVSPPAHAAPQLGLTGILPSQLQPPTPRVPASFLIDRSSLPSSEGSAGGCAGHRAPSAFTASSATTRPLYRLCHPPWPRPPPLSPQRSPGILPISRSTLAGCERSLACPARHSGQRHPAAVPSEAHPPKPNCSTDFLPSFSPSQPPIQLNILPQWGHSEA